MANASRSTTLIPVLYCGRTGRAHEFILDCATGRSPPGIEAEDDREALHGLRLPRADDVVPVPGTLMIEPTESEPKSELDRSATR